MRSVAPYSGRDLASVLRAVCVLAVLNLLLRVRPAALLRWSPGVALRGDTAVSPDYVVRIVRLAARLVGGTCLARALACRLLLARAGVPVTVVVGAAARGSFEPLCAHAWIEHHGVPVVHGEPLPAFAAIWRLLPGAER